MSTTNITNPSMLKFNTDEATISKIAKQYGLSESYMRNILNPPQKKRREPKNKSNKAAFGVAEWASRKASCQSGCSNDCKYCFSKSYAIRFKQHTPESWSRPVIDHDKVNKSYGKCDGRIFFSPSHDITPDNLTECLIVLKKMLASGNALLIVSKPHISCIKALCKELQPYKKQILFRFTIGSADNKVLKYWEPNAPRFQERLASLKWAYEHGYSTSISSEPMLDLHIDRVIDAVKPYVTDSIWLGRVNGLRQAISLNCPGDKQAKLMADNLLNEQPDDYLRGLYDRYKTDPLIKFKDSIKKVVGLERPTEKGLDI